MSINHKLWTMEKIRETMKKIQKSKDLGFQYESLRDGIYYQSFVNGRKTIMTKKVIKVMIESGVEMSTFEVIHMGILQAKLLADMNGLNYALLKSQKAELLNIRESMPESKEKGLISGLIHLLDTIGDYGEEYATQSKRRVLNNLSQMKEYVCTNCQKTNLMIDNGEITVGLCERCDHPLWNDDKNVIK